MKNATYLILLFVLLLAGCSGGANLPVVPSNTDNPNAEQQIAFKPAEASDVLYDRNSDGINAYKAFGIFRVIVDPSTLTAEIVRSRMASKIGDTFDADLTQFLTKSPCYNCLRIDGIEMVAPDQVQIGFAIKHPFGDITKRPDLHAFDVRGIIIADGNWNFPGTKIAKDASTEVDARANVSMIANPDGFTSHFDELAADPHYFDPPLDYNATINPYKRYFVDGGTPAFNPNLPSGHNVFPVGGSWQTVDYIFNLGSGSPLDFVFIADCAYGQSATFQNRTSPLYFLPEFNRKEAWNVVATQLSGDFKSNDNASSAVYRISVCDWQAGLEADPDYPQITNLGGIKAKSEIAKITIDIPGVSGVVESTGPRTGEGFEWNPYIYEITVTNTSSAAAGNYFGIVAVRDDLNGQRGPIGIPESPAGFPFAGPEIYDYSSYQVFPVRVKGTPPEITSTHYISHVFEGEYVNIDIDISEPDGDVMSYQWTQLSPVTPVGLIDNPKNKSIVWQAPTLFDVPSTGVQFVLRVFVSDVDGQTYEDIYLTVNENNSAPECLGITSDPYFGVVWFGQPIDLTANAFDPDGDSLLYEWDLDWGGDSGAFDIDATGQTVNDHSWNFPGFYKAGCRLTEEGRINTLSSICSRDFIARGISQDIKIDDSSDTNPGYYGQDVLMLMDLTTQKPVYHVTWIDISDSDIYYANNANSHQVFGNYQVISRGPSSGSVDDACIFGTSPIVHVAWIEYDSSVAPALYKVKINSSSDGGNTWGAMGGERVILGTTSPDYLRDIDFCAGPNPGTFYMFFMDVLTGENRCSLAISNDYGASWHYPASGGMFRDGLPGAQTQQPKIDVSADGRIHTFWQDNAISPSSFVYDWSDDQGETWNTDMIVSNSTGPNYGSMDVDDFGNVRCVWTDTNGVAYERSISAGNPPTLGSHQAIFNLGLNDFEGIDIYVSPPGRSAVITISMYLDYLSKYSNHYLSCDFSQNTISLITWKTMNDQITLPVVAGYWHDDPNGLEVLSTWVDTRSTYAPFNAHIWGDITCFAEGF